MSEYIQIVPVQSIMGGTKRVNSVLPPSEAFWDCKLIQRVDIGSDVCGHKTKVCLE